MSHHLMFRLVFRLALGVSQRTASIAAAPLPAVCIAPEFV